MSHSPEQRGDAPSDAGLTRLYGDLSSWWPVMSAPDDYAEEAAFYRDTIIAAAGSRPRTLLELGSGGGNNASHLKADFEMTLVDLSPGMLAVSRALNPECEHVLGDMRDVRLGRHFDAVFIHDAIVYMTTEEDLRRAIETASAHCRPGGVALLVPDFVRETFSPSTGHGGHDVGERSLRYLAWTWNPDPTDSTYTTDFAYLLRENGEVSCAYDRHVNGLFSRDAWLQLLAGAAFDAECIPCECGETGHEGWEAFIAIRRKR